MTAAAAGAPGDLLVAGHPLGVDDEVRLVEDHDEVLGQDLGAGNRGTGGGDPSGWRDLAEDDALGGLGLDALDDVDHEHHQIDDLRPAWPEGRHPSD